MAASNLPNTGLTPAAQRAQAYNVVGSRTLTAALVSKLRDGNAQHHNKNAPSLLTGSVSQSDMMTISQEQQLRTIDNENAINLMPEIEWASRVLVSSILSPKDMTKRELIYNIDLDWIPPSAKSAILEQVKKDMERVYDYGDSLYSIFKDALFTKGSHPRLVLPEAAVDRIINSGETLTMESLSTLYDKDKKTLKRKGYFGPHPRSSEVSGPGFVTMESYAKARNINGSESSDEAFIIELDKPIEEGDKKIASVVLESISITDNFEALKLPSYLEVIAASERQKLAGRPEIDFGDMSFATGSSTNESFIKPEPKSKHAKLQPNEFRNAVYKGAPNNMVTHLQIPGRDSLKRRSVGRPLVLSLPPEAVIPIHVPGDPRRKLGYLIMIGENGHPISLEAADQTIARGRAMFNSLNGSNSTGKDAMGSMIISKAARNLTGGQQVTKFRELSKIFEQLVEDNILPRLMAGAYPGGAEIADTADLYTLMLSRTLCSMRTRLVFVPAEMITYFAFDFHSNGMGKSLLDANKMLIAFRAGLLLTRMTGEMRNSIPLTKITMKFDDDDADWEKAWEEAADAITKTRQPQYPLSTLAINDLMDWVHRAGFVWSFENHPRIPDTGFDFEKIHHENPLPDKEFYDGLGRQIYMGFGIPPELMDSTYDPEFAIAVASRNIMFTQTILEHQKVASGLMTEDHHRLILSDGIMLNDIVGVVKSKWGEITSKLPDEQKTAFEHDPMRFAIDLVETIVTSITVSLPAPDATTLENQRERFQEFNDFVDNALNNFISDAIISPDIAPELAGKITAMQPVIAAAIKRKYMADNNILPELFEICQVDEEGRPMFDLLQITEDYLSGLAVNVMSFAKALAPIEESVRKDSETLNLGNDAAAGGGGWGGDSGGGSSSGGGGDEFGLGDMDMSLNAPAEEGEAGGEGTGETPPGEDTTPPEPTI